MKPSSPAQRPLPCLDASLGSRRLVGYAVGGAAGSYEEYRSWTVDVRLSKADAETRREELQKAAHAMSSALHERRHKEHEKPEEKQTWNPVIFDRIKNKFRRFAGDPAMEEDTTYAVFELPVYLPSSVKLK